MNRLDRLFALTTYLQGRRCTNAAELAALFEISVRTVYRDIAALSEAGIPIVSMPGQGYALSEGYFLPPLHFSPDEAIALVLGARLLTGHAPPRLASAARQGVEKILAILDDGARSELEDLDTAVDVAPASSSGSFDLDDERLSALRAAILDRRIVTLRYFGRNRSQETTREVEPLRLVYVDGVWYLSAFCLSRNAERAFRLDRIDDLHIEQGRFRRREATGKPADVGIDVRVRVRPEVSRWVNERQHWSFVRREAAGVQPVFLYRPHSLNEIAPWLLGWGTGVEVLSPAELRSRLRDEARALSELLT